MSGVPARIIPSRFGPEEIAALLRLEWWNYYFSEAMKFDVTDMPEFLRQFSRHVSEAAPAPFAPGFFIWDEAVGAKDRAGMAVT